MGPEQTSNPLIQLFPFILIMFVFYFLLFKPEKDKQKKHREALNGLKKNDEVVTSGGIHGTVVNVKPDTITLRVDDNVKLEVDKEAVVTIKTQP